MDKTLNERAVETTRDIYKTRYNKAEVIFLAGSFVRGEETRTSDLDLVVIFKQLPNPFRESFYFNDFPIETFVHDPETLNFFLQNECRQAFSPLMQMIDEGIEIPKPTEFSADLKKLAAKMKESLHKISNEEIERMRYGITNLVDDIKFPRSKFELTATGTALYSALSDFYLLVNELWLAEHKTIPRILEQKNPEWQNQFCLAFEDLFVNGKSEKVILLAEDLLQPYGGFLFDGYRNDAPKIIENR
ncbi:MAG: nucleotidyltransferase domain-containing protein [Acidobacteriota bacterium]|nr:nucleotidyltransferase domain-containing protein [Acidobacteriota bacterium]